MKIFYRIVAGMMLLYIGFAGGHLYTADDWSRYYAARNFLESLRPEVPDKPHVYGVEGRNDMRVSHFPPGLSLVSMPLLLAGKIIPHSDENRAELIERFLLSFTNQIIVAFLIGMVFLTVRRTGVDTRWAILISAGMGTGSLAFPYAKHYWAEPLQVTLILGTLLAVDRITRSGKSTGGFAVVSSCLALAFLVKYESVIPILIIGLYIIVARRPESRAQILSFICPFIIAGIVSSWYNIWRFGSPLDFGYGGLVLPSHHASGGTALESSSLVFPFIRRLALLLFSPGQGLVVYVPAVVLAIYATAFRGFPVFIRLGFVCAFALLALYGILDRSSTWCWGPRYLFPSMVLWWPALARFRNGIGRGLVISALCIGIVIAILGVLVNFHDGIEEIRESRGFSGWEWVQGVQRDPELSPIVWHARLLPEYVERSIRPEADSETLMKSPVKWRHKRLDIVWISLVVGGFHRMVLVVPVLCIGAGLWLIRSTLK